MQNRPSHALYSGRGSKLLQGTALAIVVIGSFSWS